MSISLAGMAASLAPALLHACHGSVRPISGFLYALLLLNFLRTSHGRRVSIVLLSVFAAFFLPFFLVQGFADRFAYLSSTAAMFWLAFALPALPNLTWRVAGAVAIISFFAIGMQNRISTWNEAGKIARLIPAQIKILAPDLPVDAKLLIENAPIMHKQAYVFISGLTGAMELAYHQPLDVRQTRTSEQYTFAYKWIDGRIVESAAQP